MIHYRLLEPNGWTGDAFPSFFSDRRSHRHYCNRYPTVILTYLYLDKQCLPFPTGLLTLMR